MGTLDKNSVTLRFDILPESTHKALTNLSQQAWLKENNWYLAGGTALALQCGHRKSVDLDFFTQQKEFEAQTVISHLVDTDWTTSLREKGTLYGELLGAKISFIAYPFFIPKQAQIILGSVHILDARDIAVMKIIAISQRSKKRDFVDLYWYVQNREPLSHIIKRLAIQYPNLNHSYHHILKSLTYFEEANEDPDPEVFFVAQWDSIKKFFLSEVDRIGKDILELP